MEARTMLKDYYGILGLPQHADGAAIRSRYRSLAKECHPDRHGDDPLAATRFREIKEAYEVLTDPARRDAYLQQRWYERSLGRPRYAAPALHPEDVLKAAIALERRAAMMDPFRSDTASLLAEMHALLSDDACAMLQHADYRDVRMRTARLLLQGGRMLAPERAALLAETLRRLVPDDDGFNRSIDRYLSGKQRDARWASWRLPLIAAASILLCALIRWLS